LGLGSIASQAQEWQHALSLLEKPRYGADFKHFDYVNPRAPVGGLVRMGAQGSFDNFNPVVSGIKGQLAAGLSLVYETLTVPSQDEVMTSYGLLAEAMRVAADFSSVTYRLRQEARWHDGLPVTPEDVIFPSTPLKAIVRNMPFIMRMSGPRKKPVSATSPFISMNRAIGNCRKLSGNS